ncbi:MAG: STAS domain-containing protein [Turneriella sp.]
MAEQLYFDIRYSAGSITAVADGTLNFFTSPELKKKLAAWIEPGVTAITIDLKNVPHVDSAGIAALIQASKTCAEREVAFKILSAPQSVKTIFSKSGLSSLTGE